MTRPANAFEIRSSSTAGSMSELNVACDGQRKHGDGAEAEWWSVANRGLLISTRPEVVREPRAVDDDDHQMSSSRCRSPRRRAKYVEMIAIMKTTSMRSIVVSFGSWAVETHHTVVRGDSVCDREPEDEKRVRETIRESTSERRRRPAEHHDEQLRKVAERRRHARRGGAGSAPTRPSMRGAAGATMPTPECTPHSRRRSADPRGSPRTASADPIYVFTELVRPTTSTGTSARSSPPFRRSRRCCPALQLAWEGRGA